MPRLDPRSIYYKTKRGKIKFTLSRKGDFWKFEYTTSGRLGSGPFVNRNSTTLEVHVAFATTSDPYTRVTSKAIATIPVGIRESNKKITVSYP